MLTHNGTCSFFEVGLLLLERWRTTGEGWLSELSKILLLVLTHMRTYTFTCMHKHTLVNHECNASILSCRCHSRCCLLLKAFVYVYKRTNTCTYTSTHAQTDLHAHNLQVRTHTIHATTQANMRVHYTCNYTQANMQLHTKQATTRYTSNYTQPTCNYTQPTTCNYTPANMQLPLQGVPCDDEAIFSMPGCGPPPSGNRGQGCPSHPGC